MGYFETAYIVEGTELADGVAFAISVYAGSPGVRTDGNDRPIRHLFSWGPGARPPGTPSYAGGTLYSDEKLGHVGFLSRTEVRGTMSNETADLCLLQQSFQPKTESEKVLVHIVLPPRWVPRASLKPLVQPSKAEIVEHPGERLAITYPTKGGDVSFAFWIEKLAPESSLRGYEITQLLEPRTSAKIEKSLGFNLGFVKGEVKTDG